MTMTALQAVLMITAAAVGTMITRFLPFLAFPESKPIPKFITYLGEVLPLAVMGMLVVYALRNTPITTGAHGVPELISLAALALGDPDAEFMILANSRCSTTEPPRCLPALMAFN